MFKIDDACKRIWVSFLINWKSFRFNVLNYVMLAIVFPTSYLVIGLSGNANRGAITGYVISVMLSLFVNLQASLVLNTRNAVTMEQYATMSLKPLEGFIGQCLQHIIYSIPAFFLMIVAVEVLGCSIQYGLVILWFIVAALFLSVVAIALGTLIKNPNFGSPILSMFYMLIAIITPLYIDTRQLSTFLQVLYFCNPFSHLVFSLNYSVGISTVNTFWASIGILLLITAILSYYVYKSWKSNYIVEKLNLL